MNETLDSLTKRWVDAKIERDRISKELKDAKDLIKTLEEEMAEKVKGEPLFGGK